MIRDPLYGSPDRGIYRAVARAGSQRVLVTMATPQQAQRDALIARFAYNIDGVAPFVDIVSIAHELAPHDAMIEAEPSGVPITEARLTDPRRVARGLAAIVARAHVDGHVLGGVRPELVYSDGRSCTGIAPRAEPFLIGAKSPCHGVGPCFEDVYLSPECLSGLPTTMASDVFALCATLIYLFDGAPPFLGADLIERLTAAVHGAHRPTSAPAIVRAGLATVAAARPSAAQIREALR